MQGGGGAIFSFAFEGETANFSFLFFLISPKCSFYLDELFGRLLNSNNNNK